MIAVGAMQRIGRSAHKVLQQSGLPIEYLVGAPLAAKRMAALRFAQVVTTNEFKTPAVVAECSLPVPEYLSWLLVRPLGIAYDSSQVMQKSVYGGGEAPHKELQVSRALLHEVGHIFATRELLSDVRKRITKNGRVFTPPCSAKQEEKAWVWAICALGIQLGHHAMRRRGGPQHDNTMGIHI